MIYPFSTAIQLESWIYLPSIKYSFIKFDDVGFLQGIRTNSGEYAVYQLFTYEGLSLEQNSELKGLHSRLLDEWYRIDWPKKLTQHMWGSPWACKYCETYLLQISDRFINTEGEGVKKLGEVPLEFLKKVVHDPKLKSCVENLIEYWREIGLQADMVLMEIPGWKEAFENAVKEKCIQLSHVQHRAEDLGLWRTFVDRFGKSRLENLYRECGLCMPYYYQEEVKEDLGECSEKYTDYE
jgi:hypothetical protein